MYVTLTGLFCVLFVSFGGTEMLTGLKALVRGQYEVTQVLFSMVDSASRTDGKITFPELKKTVKTFDSNDDGTLSPEELKRALQTLNIATSLVEELEFDYFDLNDDSELRAWFDKFDLNSNGSISMIEFENGFQHWLEYHRNEYL